MSQRLPSCYLLFPRKATKKPGNWSWRVLRRKELLLRRYSRIWPSREAEIEKYGFFASVFSSSCKFCGKRKRAEKVSSVLHNFVCKTTVVYTRNVILQRVPETMPLWPPTPHSFCAWQWRPFLWKWKCQAAEIQREEWGGLNEYFISPFPLAACRVEGRREAFLFWGVRVSVSFKDLRASFPLPLCYLPARVLQKAE